MGITKDQSDSILSDELAGAIASGLKPAELGNMERDALRRRVLGRVSDPAPDGTYTVRASENPWLKVSELVQVRVLRKDEAHNNQTILIRMLPGASIVPHPHSQEEECLVIEGSVDVGPHRLYEGDMHVVSPGARHPEIISPRGALLMIRSEIPPAGFQLA
jgi:quercetin dioxygenase-like cupin family protein